MVELHIEPHGTVIAIGIKSTNKQELLERFYSFWNFGATNGELLWVSSDFAYFWTTPQNLEKYLYESSFHKILNENPNGYKGKKGGVKAAAKLLAQERRKEFIPTQLIALDKVLFDGGFDVSMRELGEFGRSLEEVIRAPVNLIYGGYARKKNEEDAAA